MSNFHRVLLLKEDLFDSELVKIALDQSGFPYLLERLTSGEAFRHRLSGSEDPPDLILADDGLPDMDGYTALKLAREQLPDVPFVFVAASMDEERAIEALRLGSTDYVLMSRLSSLVPTVYRVLREASERLEHRRTEKILRGAREQLRALTVYLQHVREEERTRIAREVHDELGQALAGLKMDLIWLGKNLPAGQQQLNKRIQGMTRHIDGTIRTVRRIVSELRPGILDDLGLLAALQWQAKEFEVHTGIHCSFFSALDSEPLEANLATAFFRICQEALTNIIHHAEATRVEVRFEAIDHSLILTVRDNGRGIPEGVMAHGGSAGLHGMRERVTPLGGHIKFESESGQGTTITVSIPRTTLRRSKEVLRHESAHR